MQPIRPLRTDHDPLPIGPNKTILLSNTPYMVAGFGRRCVAGFGAPNDTPGNVLLTAKHTGLDRDSVANVSLLVTVDKRQLIERTGKVSKRQMEGIFSGIDLIMGR